MPEERAMVYILVPLTELFSLLFEQGMAFGLNCVCVCMCVPRSFPPHSYVEALTLLPQVVTLFGDIRS